MAGAFLGLLILLFVSGLSLVGGLLYYFAQFIYIIISIIIYDLRNKQNKKTNNDSHKK